MGDRVEWKINHKFFNRVLKEDGQTRSFVDAQAEEFRQKAGSSCSVLPAGSRQNSVAGACGADSW